MANWKHRGNLVVSYTGLYFYVKCCTARKLLKVKFIAFARCRWLGLHLFTCSDSDVSTFRHARLRNNHASSQIKIPDSTILGLQYIQL